MTCGIYQITLPTGLIYTGSSKNIPTRISQHRSAINAKNHYNPHIRGASEKHSVKDFVFVTVCQCEEKDLPAQESSYISAAMLSGISANSSTANRPIASGRPPPAEPVERVTLMLNAETVAKLKALGDGNMSLAVRLLAASL